MTLLVRDKNATLPHLEVHTVVDKDEKAKVEARVAGFVTAACALVANCPKSSCRFGVEQNNPVDDDAKSSLVKKGPVIILTPDSSPRKGCLFECVGERPLKDALGNLRDGITVAKTDLIAVVPINK